MHALAVGLDDRTSSLFEQKAALMHFSKEHHPGSNTHPQPHPHFNPHFNPQYSTGTHIPSSSVIQDYAGQPYGLHMGHLGGSSEASLHGMPLPTTLSSPNSTTSANPKLVPVNSPFAPISTVAPSIGLASGIASGIVSGKDVHTDGQASVQPESLSSPKSFRHRPQLQVLCCVVLCYIMLYYIILCCVSFCYSRL